MVPIPYALSLSIRRGPHPSDGVTAPPPSPSSAERGILNATRRLPEPRGERANSPHGEMQVMRIRSLSCCGQPVSEISMG